MEDRIVSFALGDKLSLTVGPIDIVFTSGPAVVNLDELESAISKFIKVFVIKNYVVLEGGVIDEETHEKK